VERHIRFDRLYNFRDLGGYRAGDGQRVARGRVYRSDSLSKLDGPDWDRFRALGIRTVIDLRHDWEIEARGRLPYSVEMAYHNLSIEHRPYDQAALGPEVDPARFLADRYAEVAADGVVELRQALELIAFAEGPIAFHCASGKDRTGLLAAWCSRLWT
jgi:protein-tyrosine phosphatase